MTGQPHNLADTLRQIKNADRLLPSQPVLSQMFSGSPDTFFERLESVLLSVLPTRSVEEKWDIRLKPGHTYASFGSDINTLYFYQLLIRLGRIRSVLELGTYIGVSTLFLAEAVGPAGRVTTVERGQEFYDIAKENFARNGYAERIEPVLGDALQTLGDAAIAGKRYDMILLDAAKERYGDMLEPALQCLSAGGLLLADDVFFQGDTLNSAPASGKGLGVRELLERAAALPGCSTVILPIGNGLLLLRPETVQAIP